MLLNRMLELEDQESIFLAEESWQDLLDLPVTGQILEEGLDTDDCIEIRDLGYALHIKEPAPIWLLLTDRYSSQKILGGLAGRWQPKITKSLEVDESEFLRAINECLSNSLADELFCESCSLQCPPHHVEERIERLTKLLPTLLPEGESILEICCGSGMATEALCRLGRRPIVMDSDRCDVCLALKGGLLEPQNSMVLDARLLPLIFSPRSFDAVVGFMVGLIDDFNWPVWRDILLKASGLAEERVLFTVYTQKEAELIARALEEDGWNSRVIDNRDSRGIYDQWACSATRRGSGKG
ncbi:MAG: class I SAM-dependent methyltransferase [Methanothrix sp.]|nr:class I SAM-dependent methyltransferase [Methanothrix sp.]